MLRHGQGFSVAELLVALGLLALIGALGIPAMNRLAEKVGRDLALQATVAALDRARSLAVMHRRRVGVCVLDSAATCAENWEGRELAVFFDNNANRQRDADEPVVHRQPLHGRRLQLQWSNWRSERLISYQPDGAVASNGTLSFLDKNGATAVAIVISKPGRARIQ